MNMDKYIWSKYNAGTMLLESAKLAQAEHELHQEQGRYIMKDDLLNLRIAMGTSKDVNEFLAVI